MHFVSTPAAIPVKLQLYVPLCCSPSNDYRYGGTCQYGCFRGYRMRGQSSVECRYTGDWSGRAPSCESKFICVRRRHISTVEKGIYYANDSVDIVFCRFSYNYMMTK